jgi:hypothetical protein
MMQNILQQLEGSKRLTIASIVRIVARDLEIPPKDIQGERKGRARTTNSIRVGGRTDSYSAAISPSNFERTYL